MHAFEISTVVILALATGMHLLDRNKLDGPAVFTKSVMT